MQRTFKKTLLPVIRLHSTSHALALGCAACTCICCCYMYRRGKGPGLEVRQQARVREPRAVRSASGPRLPVPARLSGPAARNCLSAWEPFPRQGCSTAKPCSSCFWTHSYTHDFHLYRNAWNSAIQENCMRCSYLPYSALHLLFI